MMLEDVIATAARLAAAVDADDRTNGRLLAGDVAKFATRAQLQTLAGDAARC